MGCLPARPPPDWRVEDRGCRARLSRQNAGRIGATYKSAYREPFRPLAEAEFVPYNDIEALRLRSSETAAVILEPVREAGVYVADEKYLQAARQICDDRCAR